MQVRDAVKQVLADAHFRANARRIQTELARHDGPAETASLLERLAATGQPVLRTEEHLSWAGRKALAAAGVA